MEISFLKADFGCLEDSGKAVYLYLGQLFLPQKAYVVVILRKLGSKVVSQVEEVFHCYLVTSG